MQQDTPRIFELAELRKQNPKFVGRAIIACINRQSRLLKDHGFRSGDGQSLRRKGDSESYGYGYERRQRKAESGGRADDEWRRNRRDERRDERREERREERRDGGGWR